MLHRANNFNSDFDVTAGTQYCSSLNVIYANACATYACNYVCIANTRLTEKHEQRNSTPIHFTYVQVAKDIASLLRNICDRNNDNVAIGRTVTFYLRSRRADK